MSISGNEIQQWMLTMDYTQEMVANLLGTTSGTISRWISEKVKIPLPQMKLLAYLIRGELPFPIQNLDQGWNLDFSAQEFALIQVLARREGFSSAQDWVVAKIRAYLAMTGAVGESAEIIAAETTTTYTHQKRSSN